MNMEQVQSTLLSHDTLKKITQNNWQDSALVTRGESRRRRSFDHGSEKGMSKFKVREQGVRCYGCRELGHIKRNCPNQKRKDDADDSSGSSLVVAG